MITICIPNNNLQERTYSARVLFSHLLGLKVSIKIVDDDKTKVRWDGKEICFSDILWSNSDELEYLCQEKLPLVRFTRNEFLKEDDIPVLYGKGGISRSEKAIDCDIDVLATIFFMLTRWEECVIDAKDKHGRFPGKASIAYKNGFIHRPIVNEYVEMVWNMMVSLGCSEKRKERNFVVVPTHDIDHPYMNHRFLRISKRVVKAFFHLDYKSIAYMMKWYYKDPYDVYNFFMDISDKIGVKSHFYFMSVHPSTTNKEQKPYNSHFINRLARKIISRGHEVGFHPGYFSTKNKNQWCFEKQRMESILGIPVCEGRQHYLLFSCPDTFSFWEDNNMKIDSTLSYHDIEGFRCGTGDCFPVFNVKTRKEYYLQERPLIIMDSTITGYQNYDIQKISQVMDYYIMIGKKYKMPITFLFHNSSFVDSKGKELKALYREKLLNTL